MLPDSVVIIGGGWSASRHNLAALTGCVICVNDAVMHAPRCDIAFTMDRLWFENRLTALNHMQVETYARRSAARSVLESPPEWLHAFECDNTSATFGPHLGQLNGPNSGHCALNLAFLMRPRRIELIGFDMKRGPKGECYWYAPYSWAKQTGGTGNTRYAEWATMFDEGLMQCRDAGIEVVRH